jgi:hypothetical protein
VHWPGNLRPHEVPQVGRGCYKYVCTLQHESPVVPNMRGEIDEPERVVNTVVKDRPRPERPEEVKGLEILKKTERRTPGQRERPESPTEQLCLNPRQELTHGRYPAQDIAETANCPVPCIVGEKREAHAVEVFSQGYRGKRRPAPQSRRFDPEYCGLLREPHGKMLRSLMQTRPRDVREENQCHDPASSRS